MPSAKPLNFLITGAGRGIGRGLSRLLIAQGHRVLLVDSNAQELFHTCDQIAKSLPYPTSASQTTFSDAESQSRHYVPDSSTHVAPFDALQCNLRNPRSVSDIIKHAHAFFGDKLDVLINNAAYTGGVQGPKVTERVAEGKDDAFHDAWTASLETNLTAPVMLSRACLPMLRRTEAKGKARERNASIIMMSSTRAHQSEAFSEPYAATKAGLIGLTHALAVSLKDEGISVNAIVPGWINVSNECKEADEKGVTWAQTEMSEADHEWHLTKRVGRVEDVLRTVMYLVESADFVTGVESVVDGGVSRRMVYPE